MGGGGWVVVVGGGGRILRKLNKIRNKIEYLINGFDLLTPIREGGQKEIAYLQMRQIRGRTFAPRAGNGRKRFRNETKSNFNSLSRTPRWNSSSTFLRFARVDDPEFCDADWESDDPENTDRFT